VPARRTTGGPSKARLSSVVAISVTVTHRRKKTNQRP
jgi:hypothetical protein